LEGKRRDETTGREEEEKSRKPDRWMKEEGNELGIGSCDERRVRYCG
jgi:hypothetical protein